MPRYTNVSLFFIRANIGRMTALTLRTYDDVWSGNPDTDKYWNR